MNVRRQLFQFLRTTNDMLCLYELLMTAGIIKITSPDQGMVYENNRVIQRLLCPYSKERMPGNG